MLNLTPHCSNLKNLAQIKVKHYVSNAFLTVEFFVTTDEDLNISEQFSTEHVHNEGLWDYDVVEVFVQKAASAQDIHSKYLELQISPAEQVFALYIDLPRIKTRSIRDFSELSCRFSSEQTKTGFSAKFDISLEDIPGHGNKVLGNFFSCLGPRDSRCYYALNINPEKVPDFHRPDLFIELADIENLRKII